MTRCLFQHCFQHWFWKTALQTTRRSQNFWGEGGPVLGHSTNRVSGMSPLTMLKKCMRFDALYCICCVQIINFETFKLLLLFSVFIWKKIFATVYKHTHTTKFTIISCWINYQLLKCNFIFWWVCKNRMQHPIWFVSLFIYLKTLHEQCIYVNNNEL